MLFIDKYFQDKLDHLLETHPELAEDKNKDSTNIGFLLTLSSMMQILKLVIIILNISYFIGFFWYIVSDLESQLHKVR